MVDYIGVLAGDSSFAHMDIGAFLEYPDYSVSKITNFTCAESCLKGTYSGILDITNSKTATATVSYLIKLIYGFWKKLSCEIKEFLILLENISSAS